MENYPQWNLPKEAKMRLGKGGIGSIQFTPDGTQLALSSTTGVWFYEVNTGKELSLIPWHRGSLVFSPDGRFLASDIDKGVVLWDMSTWSEVSLQEKLPSAAILRFSDDSKTLIFLNWSKSGETIYRVDVETGKTTTTQMGEVGERMGEIGEGIYLESYTLTDDRIAIGSNEGRIEVWDTTTGKKLSTLREIGKEVHLSYYPEKNHVLTMRFSPDGTRLATGNLDTTVQLWDTTSGEELIVFQKPIEGNMWIVSRGNGKDIINNPMKEEKLGRPSTLEFSPDGSLLACGNEDCTIKLWDTITGELVVTLTGHLCAVCLLTFSPDGAILASGSWDGTVRFWDIKKQRSLPTHIAGHLWINTASFLNDDSTLVSVSSDGIITNWDLQNLQKTTLQTKIPLEESVFCRTYRPHELSPDGTVLANHGIQSDPTKPNFSERVLRLTDVKTGSELGVFPNGNGWLFSPDGRFLGSWGGNKIHLLNTETGEKREIIIAEEPEEDDADTHTPMLSVIEFSPDGKKIVSGTDGGLVQIWEVETGIELSSFFEEQPPIDGSYQGAITTFAFSTDGSLLAVGTSKNIRILGSSSRPHFKEISAAKHGYDAILVFSPDDSVLLRNLYSGEIQLLDVATGKKLTSLDGHSVSNASGIKDLKFSPDNKTLMSVGGGNILLWDWDKVLASARGKEKENAFKHILPITEESEENILQFFEHSPQLSNNSLAKTSYHILWKGEVYLANEWYDVALEEFTRYLTAADRGIKRDVATRPSFHRKLFARIGKASKDIQDKEGFADMVNQLIERSPDSLSIQLNAHLVLVKFYNNNDMLQKAAEHLQKIDLLTADLRIESLALQVNVYLSLASYYHDSDMFDKADEYIQEIEDITAELASNAHGSLRLKLAIHFGLAEYYREHDSIEKVDAYIRKTGFVTEDAWMVLGPFDNADGIGFDTAYIPEDITEIDLAARYDGLDGVVGWKKFTDAELDGYIHLGEQYVDWQVSYAFATINSPDERDVQFRFDSDDQGKVWLNGKAVFSNTEAFMAMVDRHTIPVKLKPGKNSILVKVCNEKRGWGFFLRITDEDGQPFDDLIINRQ